VPKTKLQKQLSRKIGNKTYPKYVITVPAKQIQQLGWKEGEELTGTILKDRLMIRRAKSTNC